jgi:hypothetical protein
MIQILVRRELIKLPIHIDGLRKLLQRIALLFVNDRRRDSAGCRPELVNRNAMFLICFKNESLAREQIKNRFG